MTLPLPRSHQMLRRKRLDTVSSLDLLTHSRRVPVTMACARERFRAADHEGPGMFTVVPKVHSSLWISRY